MIANCDLHHSEQRLNKEAKGGIVHQLRHCLFIAACTAYNGLRSIKEVFVQLIKPVYAHCDLPCGVYDPAQARIEALSVKKILEKMQGYEGDDRVRAIIIKEERAELVKHHLMVLWADYFKPEHLERWPELHDKFWRAIKQASDCKHHDDVGNADTLLEMIDDIAEIFAESKS